MINNVFSAFPTERAFLADLLAAAPGDTAVEIGCLLGATTVVLAAECRRQGKRLVCIDPWDGQQDGSGEDNYRAFLRNIEPFADVISVRRGRSQGVTVPKGQIGFVFVDGDHRMDGCLADLRRFWSLLVPGGVLAVHDAFDCGWGAGIRAALDTFGREHSPLTVTHSVYYPTEDEEQQHGHSAAGVAVIRKPLGGAQ